MKLTNVKLVVTFILWFGVSANHLMADNLNTNQHKIVDGISIYLGVIPAEIIEGIKASNMHGGLPSGQFRYHVTVAIFDDRNNRLDHARISTRLSTQNDKTEFQTLDAMKFNQKLVYGNYFTLTEPGPYRIEVIIKHPKYSKPIKTEFKYQISHASLSTSSRLIR